MVRHVPRARVRADATGCEVRASRGKGTPQVKVQIKVQITLPVTFDIDVQAWADTYGLTVEDAVRDIEERFEAADVRQSLAEAVVAGWRAVAEWGTVSVGEPRMP